MLTLNSVRVSGLVRTVGLRPGEMGFLYTLLGRLLSLWNDG